jgi:hypothetical protein
MWRKRLLSLPRRSKVNDIVARAIIHRRYGLPSMACISLGKLVDHDVSDSLLLNDAVKLFLEAVNFPSTHYRDRSRASRAILPSSE